MQKLKWTQIKVVKLPHIVTCQFVNHMYRVQIF